jgi:hypothetical protein
MDIPDLTIEQGALQRGRAGRNTYRPPDSLGDNAPMPIRLTEQQQHALDAADAQPPQAIDPRTDTAYALIPLTEYEAVREIVEDERRQRAIRAVALRNAGRRVDEAP